MSRSTIFFLSFSFFEGGMGYMNMHIQDEIITKCSFAGIDALNLLHSGDVGGLHVILEALDLLLEVIDGDLLVFHDKIDLIMGVNE